MDSAGYPEAVRYLDADTGYVWGVVGPHPNGDGWLAVRWLSPGLGYSSHAATVADGRVETWLKVAPEGADG